MKVPYYCPYCDQTSTRKWNLSTHIKRKHEDQFDPFEIPNKIVLTDQYYRKVRPQSLTSSDWPQFDWSNPIPYKERSINYENLLDQLRKLNENELIFLIYKIYNFPQLKRSNSKDSKP